MRTVTAAAAAAALAACGRRSSGPAFAERDSAGVTIDESHAPAWGSGQAWTVEAQPAVRIGTVDGPEPYRLFHVGGAAVLSDGRIAVLDGGSSEVRIFSKAGTWIRTMGGKGEGPGEFTYPYVMCLLPGDTLAVADARNLSLFDAAGSFVRSSPGALRVAGRFADGRYLVQPSPPLGNLPAKGTIRPSRALATAPPGASQVDTLIVVPGDEWYVERGERTLSVQRRPLGRIRSIAVQGDEVATGDGTTFQIRVLTEDGTRVRLIRRDADLTLAKSTIARFEASIDTIRNEAYRKGRRQLMRDLGYPDRLPAYDRLFFDPDGDLWARHYVVADERPSHWSVFDPSGRWLGVVVIPGGLRLFDIGDDYVLGRATDSLGVEYVEEHRLDKPGTRDEQ